MDAEELDTPGRPPCALDGRMKLNRSVKLLASRDDDVSEFAQFADKELALSMLEVPGYGEGPVRLRARTTTGFALDGWIERTSLVFSARQRIELAGPVAYIPRGALLHLKVGTEKAVVVTTMPRRLVPIDALVPCEDLTMGRIPAEPPSEWVAPPDSEVRLVEMKKPSLPIAPIPGGTPTFTLFESARNYFTVVKTSEGLHLHFEDGIVVDGWVREADVAPLSGFGTSGIGCGGIGILHEGHSSVQAQSGLARRRMPIYVGASPVGDPRGTVDAGTDMIVLAVENGFAEVVPRCGEIRPAGKNKFFVAASALDLGPKVPIGTLKGGCK